MHSLDVFPAGDPMACLLRTACPGSLPFLLLLSRLKDIWRGGTCGEARANTLK
jgi:hypothetical protein